MEINSHSACILTNIDGSNNEVNLGYFPGIKGDYRNNKIFVDQMQHGVSIGCSVRICLRNISEILL